MAWSNLLGILDMKEILLIRGEQKEPQNKAKPPAKHDILEVILDFEVYEGHINFGPAFPQAKQL